MKLSSGDPTSTTDLSSSWQRLRISASAWAAPTNGLPSAKVIFAFPVVLLLILTVLVALGITGSSTGILNQFFSSSSDPRLIAGQPQAIRSDEWMVQTPLVISQVQEGLPVFNQNFPGGTDSTVQSDLPSWDWSMAFRPHLVGFLFLPLDNAMSLRWWLPAFAMIAACFAFFVTINPRRPLVAAIIATSFFFAPFFQWWYLPITFWPVAWAFSVMTAAIWLLRSPRLLPKLILLALVAYLTVTVAIGVYVPFMIPALLVAVAFAVGLLLRATVGAIQQPLHQRLLKLLPLPLAGIVGGLVVGVWVVTRIDSIGRFLGTIYPGQRITLPGTASFRQILSLLAAPFSKNLGVAAGVPLDANASEASSFFLVGLFLLAPLGWMAWRHWRNEGRVDWLVISLLVLLVLFAAYLVLPGWGLVSHLLLLDRTTAARVRPGIGIMTVIVIAVYVEYVDAKDLRVLRVRDRRISIATVLSAIVMGGLALVLLVRHEPLIAGFAWVPILLVFMISVALLAGGRFGLGAAALLAMSVAVSGAVNPLYVGVYDLNGTTLMRYMKSLDSARVSEWVGVGSILPTAVLQQSGLHSYSGFQSAPSPEMWAQIDPARKYENAWNRLANIRWQDAKGHPRPRNPQSDVILMNFDSCDSFAQRNVRYVLSDSPLSTKCVDLKRELKQGPRRFWIYEVART